jgi:hypothetical protein
MLIPECQLDSFGEEIVKLKSGEQLTITGELL